MQLRSKVWQFPRSFVIPFMARNKESTEGSQGGQDDADLPGYYDEEQFPSYVNPTAHKVAWDPSNCNQDHEKRKT